MKCNSSVMWKVETSLLSVALVLLIFIHI